MRGVFGLLHRWIGLTIAVFLFVSGVTGTVIAWDHELDDLLNPHLKLTDSRGDFVSVLSLVAAAEASDPRARVVYAPLLSEAGKTVSLGIAPRIDPATARPYQLDYNQVFFDPVTGERIGQRKWGEIWPISRETFVTFLYQLHYTMHIPEFWGIDQWGLWLMGGVAIVWVFDCFIGFYLTLPTRRAARAHRAKVVAERLDRGFWQRWKPAWLIKTSGSTYRINFDIHRAFGLWTWIVLFILAVTSVSLNLYKEVALPVVKVFSSITPTPFDQRSVRRGAERLDAKITYEQMADIARAEGSRRGWEAPVGALRYYHTYGFYAARFFGPGEDHGAMGAAPMQLYFDDQTGAYIGDWVPWRGTAGDLFLQLQFPLHSGRIAGLPGRIFISVMGLVVAALSVTGVVIWYRKRAARLSVRRRTPIGDARPSV
jgi:uncharacterized iron-regulated membrane protein